MFGLDCSLHGFSQILIELSLGPLIKISQSKQNVRRSVICVKFRLELA